MSRSRARPLYEQRSVVHLGIAATGTEVYAVQLRTAERRNEAGEAESLVPLVGDAVHELVLRFGVSIADGSPLKRSLYVDLLVQALQYLGAGEKQKPWTDLGADEVGIRKMRTMQADASCVQDTDL
ncbi:hypothetical protein PHYPSEUDO_008306 [Phytophthora pseudosyringae]|uniref:Uncharacterized protein n=1 Tax=Phytophthora pseudosyringae TaxID=221518 RepID=A0A8T1VF14_9STRA|nr:hypothetical protein PHYPSEUDO_008306 [Phytophthora pseudosyringae]